LRALLQVAMSYQSSSLARPFVRPAMAVSVLDDNPAFDVDRRRHPRFEVNLLGRFMRGNREEYPCRVTDISVGGAALIAPVSVDLGERIIAYLDQIGGIEGTVTRASDAGFSILFTSSMHKREKLAGQITWLINRSELDGIEARRPGHERMASGTKSTTMRLPNDQEYDVVLLDVSISGASVLTPDRPALGTEVMIGQLRALVVRHHMEGVGVQFLDIQNPDALRKYFG
jgi:PilZ domain